MDWLKTMVDSLVWKLRAAEELKGSRERAIDYVKEHTVAGPKAWAEALKQLGWGQ